LKAGVDIREGEEGCRLGAPFFRDVAGKISIPGLFIVSLLLVLYRYVEVPFIKT